MCLCVCLSAAICHYCTDPDVTWGHFRGCPLVVHCWADLQSGHGLRCYGKNANPSYKLASIPRYDDIVRTAAWAGSARVAGRRCSSSAGDARRRPVTGERPQNRALHTANGRGWPAGDCRRRGPFSTLRRQSGMRAFPGDILATKSERKMLASTCLYSLYAWLIVFL